MVVAVNAAVEHALVLELAVELDLHVAFECAVDIGIGFVALELALGLVDDVGFGYLAHSSRSAPYALAVVH